MQLLNLTLFDFAVVVFTSGATLMSTILATLIYFSHRLKNKENLWLALLLLAAGSYLATQLLIFGRLTALSQNFYYLPLRFTYAFGPMIYFYVRQSIKPQIGWRTSDWIHLILPIGQAVLTIWLGFQSIEIKNYFWLTVDQPWYGMFDAIWTPASMVLYSIAAWRILNGGETAVSNRLKKFLHPTLVLVLLCAAVAFLMDVLLPQLFFTTQRTLINNAPLFHTLPVIVYSVSLIWVAILAFKMSQTMPEQVKKQRKENYGITPNQLTTYKAKLDEFINSQAPHLDPELTLTKLAYQLDLPPKHLSYVINQTAEKSFTTYINELRVASACQLLRDKRNHHKSILDIALESGFSSKSTFNRIFRDQTGMTPSKMRSNS